MSIYNDFKLKAIANSIKEFSIVKIYKIGEYQNTFDGIVIFKYNQENYARYVNYEPGFIESSDSDNYFRKTIIKQVQNQIHSVEEQMNKITFHLDPKRTNTLSTFWQFVENQLHTFSIASGQGYEKREEIKQNGYEKLIELLKLGKSRVEIFNALKKELNIQIK